MKNESGFITFLYTTPIGRIILKAITNKHISDLSRLVLATPVSKPIIKRFIKNNNIDMSLYQNKKYKSFNDFFVRKRVNIDIDNDSTSFVSPCDGYLTVYDINENSFFKVKNSIYSLSELLQDEQLAKEFCGGKCFIYRLTPKHFHRYSFIDDGKIIYTKKIPGILHCVRPVALDNYPVYIQNQREYAVIETTNFGKVIQMEVGAIIVGRINNNTNHKQFKRGEEKGYFEFGGSTIIVLTKKDVVIPDKSIADNSKCNIETDVNIGQKTATKIQ